MENEIPTTKAEENGVVLVVQNQKPSSLSFRALIMVCIGSVLLVACLIFFILFYLYFRNRRRRDGIDDRIESSSSSSPDEANSRGLEPSVLNTLSDFRYSSNSNCGGGTPPPKECAVCLSEFQEDEMGRVLPNCKHSFHLNCIDIWFKFNSNCPLCRTQVAAILPAVIINDQDRHRIAPPVSPTEEEEEDTVSICSTSTYQDKKLPVDLTSIICA